MWAEDLTLYVSFYAVGWVYKSLLYIKHTHAIMWAEGLTGNVRSYAVGRVYKSSLYTTHTHTHTSVIPCGLRTLPLIFSLMLEVGYTSHLCLPHTHGYDQGLRTWPLIFRHTPYVRYTSQLCKLYTQTHTQDLASCSRATMSSDSSY